jgi:hypothetical protein
MTLQLLDVSLDGSTVGSISLRMAAACACFQGYLHTRYLQDLCQQRHTRACCLWDLCVFMGSSKTASATSKAAVS